ncbi:MAG: 23S rRNA (pseudouridine(1915)-N(3))-methyltransferase RlmH [Oscillospiraceae bacterium]
MLNIEIVCVGKTGQDFITKGCEEYAKRSAPFFKLKITEISETRLLDDSHSGRKRVIEEESRRILKLLERTKGMLVVLCVEGKQLSSERVAQLLERTSLETGAIVFVIGGSLGLSDELKLRAHLRLSLSELTLPHQLARLVLLEQLYRAGTINNNIKYHK